MDECDAEQRAQKHTAVETARPPLVPAEKNNAHNRRIRTREVNSRYKSTLTSPSFSSSSGPRRCPSPNITRTVPSPSPLAQKRAQSAERKRPSTPPSTPPTPSTPTRDSSTEVQFSSSRLISGRTLDGLWPSTMRSLSVSFQSDTFSLPITKREKPVTHTPVDRTLRPPSNVAVQRKPTPERKQSPFRGKNGSDQSENSKPIDQHRWPSRTGGKVSLNASNKSTDLTDKSGRISTTPVLRMPMADGVIKPLQKSASDLARKVSSEQSRRVELESELKKLLSSTPNFRSQSLPSTGPSAISSSVSRGVSPLRARPSTPPRGAISPSRIRPSNTSTQSNSNSTSVLSFIADFRKGKKGANQIEDCHQLRLLYNRYLQWRYANATANIALYVQNVTAERTLYDVWNTTLELWESVTMKKIDLQKLRLELKLNLVLNEQMAYLEDWALLERDHSNSLSGAIEDLQASTLRLPVTGGARADIETIKIAVCSAINVMQAMGSFLHSLLSRMDGLNCLVSELAELAAQEKAMLDDCEALLASTATTQVEEYSLRTHLIQLKQVMKMAQQPIFGMTTLP